MKSGATPGITAAMVASFRLASAGWKVAVTDYRPFGGTCALQGCDPKKMLITGAQVIDDIWRMTGRGVVAQFLKQGGDLSPSQARGKIIFISSVHELIPWAGHVNYAASKCGTALLMKSLAQEVADRRIRVNSIAPGAMKTKINREAWERPEAEQTLLRLIPYGRIGTPDDVAEAALWLASDASDYVVGTTPFVDGGMSLYPEFREGG